ncbi:MAG: hypothetical protein GX573_09915 [Chloroflexi bacterium]|nr:hypothetical protein [Chloroflexota bacterium]
MKQPTERPTRLLCRASETRCASCPPDRVCAWACVQGTSVEDIIIGAMLEQGLDWALRTSDAECATAHQALWETFNS